MSAIAILYIGAEAPEAYELSLTSEPSGVDLSTVTAAVLRVKKTNGVETSWAVTMSSQTSTTLKLTHVFAANELDAPGSWAVYAELTLPTGKVRSKPRSIIVRGKFDVTT